MERPAGAGIGGSEAYLYLLMYAPGNAVDCNESIPGAAWLQKEMRLLMTTVPGLELEFTGGRLGAYCRDLDDMRTRGVELGYITQLGRESDPFWLSERGLGVGRRLWDGADEDTKREVSDLKRLVNDMSYDEMVAFSCSVFPDAANSEIMGQFDRTRMDAAVSLFRKGKISLERAAHVAGLPRGELVPILEGRGIPAYAARSGGMLAHVRELEAIT